MTGNRYVLAVKKLSESVDYYQNKLGLKSVWHGDGWHFLVRDSLFVMLGECPDDRSAFETENHSYFAYIEVEGIDQLYQEYLRAEVEILHPVKDQPWGQREFGIRTIDGHRIMFGEEI
ncbi:glyoxalase [Muriicola soli]|uniref:Glyoxalase n=2 Tax=Muriicola soli TaxID=2507538 RepID=A0A411ECW3_9FLAO|nr:glyoxalase [Muriicola soli]